MCSGHISPSGSVTDQRKQQRRQRSPAAERPLSAEAGQDFPSMGWSTVGCKRLIDPAEAFCGLLNLTQETQTRLITTGSQGTAPSHEREVLCLLIAQKRNSPFIPNSYLGLTEESSQAISSPHFLHMPQQTHPGPFLGLHYDAGVQGGWEGNSLGPRQ